VGLLIAVLLSRAFAHAVLFFFFMSEYAYSINQNKRKQKEVFLEKRNLSL